MKYSDLKLQIISDLNRDDCTEITISYVESTIRRLQRDFFYATPVTGYLNTVVGQVIYPTAVDSLSSTLLPLVPMDLVRIDYIRLNNSSVWQWLVGPVEYESILHSDVNIPSTQSLPTSWAVRDAIFRLFPAPDQIYLLELTGNGKIPVPPTDDDTNFWTENASDLVRFMTLAQIYAVRIKDANAANAAMQVAEQHRISLVRETQQKSVRSQFTAFW